nr:hypothetical protein HmN_001017700 [Hymenolepis microstoma]
METTVHSCINMAVTEVIETVSISAVSLAQLGPNTRSSSVQKPGPKQSRSSDLDTKSRSRYSEFNKDHSLNKSCLNGLDSEMEDMYNSNFEIGDSLSPEILIKSKPDSGDNEIFSILHPVPNLESDFQRSKEYLTVSPQKISSNNTKYCSTIHKMSPGIENEEIFQNEQQCHKTLEDQANVSYQNESSLPTRTISKNSSFLSKCIETLKQTSQLSTYDASKSRLENDLVEHIAPQDQIDYDRVDHVGTREEALEIFSKFGKADRRRMAAQQSGILVRAVNVSARREPQAGLQASKTLTSSKALHCHECGVKYPTTSVRFCPECGVKKITI